MQDIFLFIIDTEYKYTGMTSRQIQVFDSLADAIEAKDDYVDALANKYLKNELLVVESLAKAYVARFRVPAPGSSVASCPCPASTRSYLLQVIIRIESGKRVNDTPQLP